MNSSFSRSSSRKREQTGFGLCGSKEGKKENLKAACNPCVAFTLQDKHESLKKAAYRDSYCQNALFQLRAVRNENTVNNCISVNDFIYSTL